MVDKLKVRLMALAMLLLCPVLLPLAAMHKCRVDIIYFFLVRSAEFRTGVRQED